MGKVVNLQEWKTKKKLEECVTIAKKLGLGDFKPITIVTYTPEKEQFLED